MSSDKLLDEIADDGVISFSGDFFHSGKIKLAIWNAINNLHTAFSSNLKSQGFELHAGKENYTEYKKGHNFNLTRWKSDHVWFQEGADCEILEPGASGWQKGKLRIKVSVEFIEDEPILTGAIMNMPVESPLDLIRQADESVSQS